MNKRTDIGTADLPVRFCFIVISHISRQSKEFVLIARQGSNVKVPHVARVSKEFVLRGKQGVCPHCKAMYRTLLATCGSAKME